MNSTKLCSFVVVYAIVPLPWSLATAQESQSLDREALFKRAHGAFAAADRDGDHQVTLEEYFAVPPDDDRADRMQRFHVFDFDGDATLSLAEFQSISAPADERGMVPDPMAEFADQALARWEDVLAAADGDGDAALSWAEWPAKRIASQIPELADVRFALWDRDNDGKVDRSDVRRLIDLAYGLIELDGRPLRTPQGRMFAWYFFRRNDADHNDLLARKEFIAGFHPANVNTAELFEKLDTNRDGQLTQHETWPVFCHDTVDNFLTYDRDRNGYLSADEILAIGWGRYLARRTVPVFDDDGDGKLSFREFRLTNFANQASDWWQIKDLDGDGRISWREFYREKSPLLVAQSRFFFDRYDRDHDGLLSPFEFPSEADPAHAQLLACIDSLQRCLSSEIDFARHVCQLTNEQVAELQRAGDGVIEVLAERMAATLGKSRVISLPPMGAHGEGKAVPVLMPEEVALIRAPHLAVRHELVEMLRSRSAKRNDGARGVAPHAGTWKKLEEECVRARQHFRQNAVLTHIAALDDVLLLSSQQRRGLGELLAKDAASAWWRPIYLHLTMFDPTVEWFLARTAGECGNGFFFGFDVPDSELKRRLTPTQWEALVGLREPHDHEIVFAQRAIPRPAGAAAPAAPGGKAGMAAGGPGPRQPHLARRLVRQGPTIEYQFQRLSRYVEERLGELESACGLSSQQRDKLALAAKRDLARWKNRSASVAMTLEKDEEFVVQTTQARGAAGRLPLAIFSDDEANFQKVLQTRLDDDQKRKLAELDGRRRALQRQALLSAVVAGFERDASLTAAQREALTAVLEDWLANADGHTADAQVEFVRYLANVPFERLKPVFIDFQVEAARQHYEALTRVLQWHERQRGNQGLPVMAGAVSATP